MKESGLNTGDGIEVVNLYAAIGLEYVKFERERKREIEIKAGFSIALIGVLITLILNLLDFSFWSNVSNGNLVELIGYITITILLCAPLITIFASLYYLLKSIKTKAYASVDIPAIKDQILEDSVLSTQRNIFKSHQNFIRENRIINQEKSENFDKGLKWLKYTFVGIVVVFLIYSIVEAIVL